MIQSLNVCKMDYDQLIYYDDYDCDDDGIFLSQIWLCHIYSQISSFWLRGVGGRVRCFEASCGSILFWICLSLVYFNNEFLSVLNIIIRIRRGGFAIILCFVRAAEVRNSSLWNMTWGQGKGLVRMLVWWGISCGCVFRGSRVGIYDHFHVLSPELSQHLILPSFLWLLPPTLISSSWWNRTLCNYLSSIFEKTCPSTVLATKPLNLSQHCQRPTSHILNSHIQSQLNEREFCLWWLSSITRWHLADHYSPSMPHLLSSPLLSLPSSSQQMYIGLVLPKLERLWIFDYAFLCNDETQLGYLCLFQEPILLHNWTDSSMTQDLRIWASRGVHLSLVTLMLSERWILYWFPWVGNRGRARLCLVWLCCSRRKDLSYDSRGILD